MADEETPLIEKEPDAVKIDLRELRREQGFPQNAQPTQASSAQESWISKMKTQATASVSNVGSNAGSSWENFITSMGSSCSAMSAAWGTMYSYSTTQLGYLALVVLTSLYATFIHSCAYLPSIVSLAPLGIPFFNFLNFIFPAVFVPENADDQKWFAVSLGLRTFRLVFADFSLFWLSAICGMVDLFGPTERLYQKGVQNQWALLICKAIVIVDTNTYIPMLWESGYIGAFDYIWTFIVLAIYALSIYTMRNSMPFCITLGFAFVLILCRGV